MIARYGGDVLTRGYHVTTTIDPTLQAAATTATRKGLETYDHRHGWNKVEQHFDLAEDEDAATAAVRLRRVPAQNELLPAVVMRSGNGSIDVVLAGRSEEHTSELQSLMRSSYAVFGLKKKKVTQSQNE